MGFASDGYVEVCTVCYGWRELCAGWEEGGKECEEREVEELTASWRGRE